MKRGALGIDEVLLFLIELVLAGLCFVSLMSYVSTLERGTLVEKNFISKDMSLLINTIYSSPNIVLVSYYYENIDLSVFQFEFKDGYVSVYDQPTSKVPKPPATRYRFGYNNDIDLANYELNMNDQFTRFELANDGKKLYIQNGLFMNNFELMCEKPIKASFGKIALDPGHGGEDTGFNGKESAMVLEYAKKLDEGITANNKNYVLSTRGKEFNYDHDVEPRDRLAFLSLLSEKDMLLSLHMGKYDAGNNYIRAYVNIDASPEFKSFICNFLDELMKTKVEGTVGVNVYDSAGIIMIRDTAKSHEMLSHKNSAEIEIGNIDFDSRIIPDQFSKTFVEVLNEYESNNG